MKKIAGIILLLTLLAGAVAVPGTLAAVPVHDVANTAENHATYLQAAQNTLNTTTQIANQVINLTAMSPEAMMTHIAGIESELGNLSSAIKQAQGLMDSAQTAQQAWDVAFKKMDTFFQGETSSIDSFADNQRMIYALDKTYQDSLRAARAAANIEEDTKRLRETMQQNQNAAGNKHAIQTQNNLIAQQSMLYIKQNQAMAAMATATIANYAKQNQEEARALAINQAYTEASQKTVAEDAALRKRLGIE